MAEALTVMTVIMVAVEAMVTIAGTLTEQEVIVIAMASKGKSKKLPLLRPETMLATAVVKRLLYT